MVRVRTYLPHDFDVIFNLYNEVVSEQNVYKQFTKDEWEKHVINHPDFDPKGLIIAFIENEIIGFSLAVVRQVDMYNDNRPGFICAVCVKKAYRRQQVGSRLLRVAELFLRKCGKNNYEFSYQSTLNFPWYIPNHGTDDHPGAPGVILNSDLYLFLLNNGYEVKDRADAFHLSLDEYSLNDNVKSIISSNEEKGYYIEVYDKNRHYGLEEFYRAINSEPFERVIKENLALENPKPFLVITNYNQILGWTGAMWTEASGRAHFDGITISPEIRGNGLGKALFCSLAQYSKEHGSKFMTFFTDKTNFARYIYLGAGFKIIQSFGIMRKEQ